MGKSNVMSYELTSIPCYKCLLVPVCRHKFFRQLTNDCKLVNDHFTKCKPWYVGESRKEVYDCLSPTQWKIKRNSKDNGWIFTQSLRPVKINQKIKITQKI